MQGEPVLGKDQGKVCLYPSTWSFSRSTLLVDTFSSVLLAGYTHLCFSPRNPSQALPVSPCNRFFHCFHINIAPCVLLYQYQKVGPLMALKLPSFPNKGWAGLDIAESLKEDGLQDLKLYSKGMQKPLGTKLLSGNYSFPTSSFILPKEKLSFAHRCCSQLRSSLSLWLQYPLLIGLPGPQAVQL